MSYLIEGIKFDFDEVKDGPNINEEDIKNEADNLAGEYRTVYSASELFSMGEESIPCLINPIIPKVGIFTIYGSSDTGKSMLFRQLAISIAKGTDFLGFNINATSNKVVFIATEDDHISTGYLLRKQAGSSKGLENITMNFETENIPEFLENHLSNNEADLIIIDCFSDVFGQNLVDTALIRQNLNVYRGISNKYKCAIGFLHHSGKRTQNLVPSKDNILSGQGFEAKMRLAIELRNDPLDGDIKHLCIVKGNYLSSEHKSASYKLSFDTNTFLFSNTGERTNYEDLAVKTDEGKKKVTVGAGDITDEMHERLLSDVFKKGKSMPASKLYDRLSLVYSKEFSIEFGRDKTRKFSTYLEDKGFINQIGTKGSVASCFELVQRA